MIRIIAQMLFAIEGEELNEDDKRPTILKVGGKVIKDMLKNQATGNDNTPVDLLMELGGTGLEIMIVLVLKIYMSGDWSRDFL